MAEIYLARVSGLGGFEKNVVVKRILPQLANDHQFIEMFLDEARIAATLQHPNIVQMYDIGAADGNYFIAMEFLHGEDVRSVMKALNKRRQPLPMAEALNVMIGVSSGLHYAHERKSFDGKPLGIIHRDVTPQNVIVTYDGGIKLVDFGIAKASNRLNETRFGTLKGKIAYMSPEQCQGAVLDRRSDVFALGIMLYELSTNLRLYRGGSDFEIMKQIVEQPVIPPTVRRPQYPVELEHIVMQALEKDPAKRYQTAQELQAELEAFVRNHRMVVSAIALSSFMHSLFEDRIAAFERAAGNDEELASALADKHARSTRKSSSLSIPGEDDLEELELELLDDDDSDSGDDVAGAGPTTVTPVSTVSRIVPPIEPAPPPQRKWSWIAVPVAVLVVGAAAWFGRGMLGTDSGSGGGANEPVVSAVAVPPPPAPADAAVEAPNVGSIRVVTSPAEAAISIDGEASAMSSPATLDGLAPGDHLVAVSKKGHLAREVKVSVKAGETAAVEVTLDPAVASRPIRKRPSSTKPPKKPVVAGKGELRIASSPSCEVIINGASRGQTPLAGIQLPAGVHRVQLVNSRFHIDKTYKVEVKANDVVKKRYSFDVP